MKLSLDLEGVIFSIEISDYRNPQKDDGGYFWCLVNLYCHSKNIDYKLINDEALESSEVDSVLKYCTALLEGELSVAHTIEPLEPYLAFEYIPDTVYGAIMKLKLILWDVGPSENCIDLVLFEEEIEYLRNYLLLVTGQINESNQDIVKMIDEGIIS